MPAERKTHLIEPIPSFYPIALITKTWLIMFQTGIQMWALIFSIGTSISQSISKTFLKVAARISAWPKILNGCCSVSRLVEVHRHEDVDGDAATVGFLQRHFRPPEVRHRSAHRRCSAHRGQGIRREAGNFKIILRLGCTTEIVVYT